MERPTVQSSGLTGRLEFVIPIVATALPETATVTPRPITAETVVRHAPTPSSISEVSYLILCPVIDDFDPSVS